MTTDNPDRPRFGLRRDGPARPADARLADAGDRFDGPARSAGPAGSVLSRAADAAHGAPRPPTPYASPPPSAAPAANPTAARPMNPLPGAPPSAPRAPRVVVGVNALEAAAGFAEIITFGLGSCIAAILYDPARHIGAMCHYMLADSGLDPRRAATDPLTFGDLSIPRLVAAFTGRGGNLQGAEAYIIGGASIASLSDMFDIGKRNTVMARAVLERYGLRLRGDETGGRASRTVSIEVQSGAIVIATPGLQPRRLR